MSPEPDRPSRPWEGEKTGTPPMKGNFTAFIVYRTGDAAALGEVHGAVGSEDVRFTNVSYQADLL